MSAKDLYHDVVRAALERDGWAITHDPYTISVARRDVYVDLGAERTLGAERGGTKIAVEIKGFIGPSMVRDLENAVGQFLIYRVHLSDHEPDRTLYLAVSEKVFDNALQEPIAQRPIDRLGIRIMVFRPEEERIVQWIN